MKIANSFLAGLILIGSLGAVKSAVAADGVIEKDRLSADAYCHEKFASVDPGTLSTSEPDLVNSTAGDIVDFYGPCSETPTGKDQQLEQRLDEARHATVYDD